MHMHKQGVFILSVVLALAPVVTAAISQAQRFSIGAANLIHWAGGIGSIFAMAALLTTYWAVSLALADIIAERTGLGPRSAWLAATLPSLLLLYRMKRDRSTSDTTSRSRSSTMRSSTCTRAPRQSGAPKETSSSIPRRAPCHDADFREGFGA